MEIRRATSADVEGILQGLAEAFEPYRNEYTPGAFADTIVGRTNIEQRMKDMSVLVAVIDEKIVGTIGYQVAQCDPNHLPFTIYDLQWKEGHIRGMAVAPEWHGGSHAGDLLAAAENNLREEGCTRITLDTTEPLKRAQRFYEKHGYKPTGKVTDFYGMSLIELAKELK